MKVLCVLAVFVAVAWAGPWPDDMAPPRFTVAPYAEDLDIAPFGVIDTIVDMVKGMLESGIAIKDKIESLVEQVNQVIDEITDFFEGIKDGSNPPDDIINEVFEKAIKEVMKVLDKIFDQIDSVFMTVVGHADEEIGDMWGADYAKMALNKVVEKLYDTYIEKAVEALQTVIDKVDIPHDILDKYWDDFMGRLMGAIDKRLKERRSDFVQKLNSRSRRSAGTAAYLPDKFKPQVPPKRSVSELDDLVYVQNPANYIDEAECGVSAFGLASDLKDALLKVQDVLVKAKTIVTEFQDKVNMIIQTASDLRKQIEDAAGDQDALDFIMGKVQEEIEKLVLELIDIIMSEMTAVIRGIIEKVDAFISDKFCPFKEKVFQWLDDVIVSTIDNILSVLENVLNLLNRIEENRWDDVIDHIMDMAKGKLSDMLQGVRQHIKDRLSQIGK